MRILFDGIALTDRHKTGVAYYAEGVVKALAERRHDIDVLYFNFLGRKGIRLPDYGDSVTPLPIRHFPGKIIRPIARLTGIGTPVEVMAPRRYDWIIYPNFVSLPSLRGTPTMIVVHDLCFLDHPDYVDTKNTTYLKRIMPSCIHQAEKIACVSRFTEDRLTALFPEVKGKTFVTYVPPVFEREPTTLSPRLRRLGVTNDRYFLFMGTLEPRKNLMQLMDAYMDLPETTRKAFSLVLAGGIGWKMTSQMAHIRQLQKAGENIVTTGYASEAERQQLYEHARAFVIASHYEGFGMPVLEAMVYDLPCAVSDIPVFRELCEDKVAYCRGGEAFTAFMQQHAAKRTAQKISYKGILSNYSWQTVGRVIERQLGQPR